VAESSSYRDGTRAFQEIVGRAKLLAAEGETFASVAPLTEGFKGLGSAGWADVV
jgi:hypothetical protein